MSALQDLKEATVRSFLPDAQSSLNVQGEIDGVPPDGESTLEESDASLVKYLRYPDHALWQLGRAVRQSQLRPGVTAGKVTEWVNKVFEGSALVVRSEVGKKFTDRHQKSLLNANFLILLACLNPSEPNRYLERAGCEYETLLKDMWAGMSEDLAEGPLTKMGRVIADRTFERLQTPFPLDTYEKLPAKTRVLSCAGGHGASHELVVERDDCGAPPAPYFDPIRIGVVGFSPPAPADAWSDANFLAASVHLAWEAHCAKSGQTAFWWGWRRIDATNPSSLTGASAGAAFWAAFRSAYSDEPLDLSIAVSGALIRTGGMWQIAEVGGQKEKSHAAAHAGCKSVVFPVLAGLSRDGKSRYGVSVI